MKTSAQPMSPFWLAGWSIALSVSWLLPNHYLPWSTFHMDAWLSMVLLLASAVVIWVLKLNVDVVAVAGISVAFEETACVAELLTPSFANVVPLNAPASAAKVLCDVPVVAVRDQEVSGAVLVLVVIVSKLPFNRRSTGVMMVQVAVNA